ncbi:hypothetical protein V5O48_014939 [Marasmius crinis-equi]|uniref:Uncharacterized protein n=1 Tax=Marasmius crinis-equi TaxID=585013 RepID=A0ABR3EVV9_9AGAR
METKRELTAEPSFGDHDLSHNSNIIQAAEEMGLFGDSTGPGGTIPLSPSKRLIIPTPNASASIRRVADQREQLVLSASSSVNANSFFPPTQDPTSYLHATYTQSPSPGPFDTSTRSVGTGPAGGSFVSNPAVALGTQGFLAPNTSGGYAMPAAGSYYPQQPQHYQPYPTQQPQLYQPHGPQSQPYLLYQPPPQNVGQSYVQAALASASVPQPASSIPTSTITSAISSPVSNLLTSSVPAPSTTAVSSIPTSTIHLSVSNVPTSPVPLPSTPAMSNTPVLISTPSVPLPVSNVPTSPSVHLPVSNVPTPPVLPLSVSSPSVPPPSLLDVPTGSNIPTSPVPPPAGDTPSTLRSGSSPKAADKTSRSNTGRPSKELVARVEACVKRLEERIEDEAEDLGVESSLIYNGLGSFCMAVDNVDNEMARLSDHPTLRYDGNFPPSQTQVGEAYDAFMRYHGKEKGKQLLKSWSAMQELQVVTQKVERNKTFSSCVSQAFSLANHFRNKGIYMFAAVAGGNVGTDQRLVKVVSVPETEKFLESGLLIEPEAFPGLFQAAVFEGTSLTYTKHQIANKARELGLTVSGPGLDAIEVPKASMSKPSSSKGQPAKKKEDTASGLASKLRIMVLDLAVKQVGGFKKKNILPWSTMVVEQLKQGIRILGYPAKTQYPWKLLNLPSEQRSRGIQNMSPEDQNRLLKACGEDQAVPLSFAKVDPIRLTENEVPILETAPDENGQVTRVFYHELEPYLLEKKVLRPPKQVKFELDDSTTVASTPTQKRSTRQKSVRPTSERDEDEVDELSALTDENEPTP